MSVCEWFALFLGINLLFFQSVAKEAAHGCDLLPEPLFELCGDSPFAGKGQAAFLTTVLIS